MKCLFSKKEKLRLQTIFLSFFFPSIAATKQLFSQKYILMFKLYIKTQIKKENLRQQKETVS